MDSRPDEEVRSKQMAEANDNRRDAVRKLGRFAAYAAPFTVLALTQKADAGTATSYHTPTHR